MHHPKLYKALIFLLTGLSSCGIDLLDMDLPEGETRLVIEGSISNLPPPHVVNISWSTSFNSQSVQYEPHALVVLSDSEGRTDTLTYISNGRYESGLEGIPERSYQLSVQLQGQTYKADSYMPAPAVEDSASIKFYPESPIRSEGYYVSLHKTEAEKNIGYYRWKVWVNDSLLNTPSSMAAYFAAIDTSSELYPLSLQFPEAFQKNDRLLFHTIKMDEQVYHYYQGMQQMMLNDGGLMGPIPLNPKSNISGNVLGLFQAISVKEGRMQIE